MKRTDGIKGFSLIEVCIALVILGLLVGSFADVYRIYLEKKADEHSSSLAYNVGSAMSAYFSSTGALPCPADPQATPDSGNAGVANCLTGNAALDHCEGGVCRVVGARDTAVDGDSAPDTVLRGALPYAALGLSETETLDYWGNRLTYAVTESQTRSMTYNELYGAINVLRYDPATDTDVPAENQDAQSLTNAFSFVLVSHGRDGKGAYTRHGALKVACPSGGGARDIENCDGDANFLNRTHLSRERGSPRFYDDALFLNGFFLDSGKWRLSSVAGHMRSKQLDNRFGIGETLPREAVDVKGNVQADRAWAIGYCPKDSAACFSTNIIAGPLGSDCSGSLVAGFVDGARKCFVPMGIGNAPIGSCIPPKRFLGFDVDKKPICSP